MIWTRPQSTFVTSTVNVTSLTPDSSFLTLCGCFDDQILTGRFGENNTLGLAHNIFWISWLGVAAGWGNFLHIAWDQIGLYHHQKSSDYIY